MRVGRSTAVVGLGFVLALAPLAASASLAQPTLVRQKAVGYTPQLVPTTTVPRPSVDGIASAAGTTYAGGKFDRVISSTGSTVSVTNIVAFDTSTGAIDTGFKPQLNNVVRDVEGASGGGVYVGGDFTSVNGAASSTLVKLNPNGTVDGNFHAPWNKGIVYDIDLVDVGGTKHLIVAGSFGKKLISLNPDSGKDDGLINQSITGEACLSSGTCSWGTTAVYDVAVANGHLVAVGNFATPKSKFFMLNLGTTSSTLSDWYYQSFAKPCSSTATRRIANLQGVDWNPSGTAFDVAATGQIPKYKSEVWHQHQGAQSGATVCDGIGRFSLTDDTKADWINYTGGDSMWEVADTGAAVYVQGHFKYVDDPDGYASKPIGDLVNGTPAARRAGIAAIDPITGMADNWSPAVPTRSGGRALDATSTGLWVGTDAAKFGGDNHYGLAFASL
jgi:Domain of unknown function (DUF5122) beta-propeller